MSFKNFFQKLKKLLMTSFFRSRSRTLPVSVLKPKLRSRPVLVSKKFCGLGLGLGRVGLDYSPVYHPPVADTYVIDGSALIQMLKPEGNITTFEKYISNIVTPYVSRKATFYKRIDIVFDVYLEKSIKGSTRDKRGFGYRVEVTKQAFLPSQCGWSKFLRNGENKSTLFQMIAYAIITSISANIATIVVTSLDVAVSNADLLDVVVVVVAHIYLPVTGQRQTLTCWTIRTLFITRTTS